MSRIFKNLVLHRSLLTHFIRRDLTVKYRGTLIGYLWSLLEPLALVLTYYFVFVVIWHVKGPKYPLTVILGVLPYAYMSQIIQGGANILVGNSGLIRRIYFPRELFMFAHVGTQLVVFLLSLLVTIPFMVFYDVRLSADALWLPVGVVLLTLFATGLGFAGACLNVLFRDVGYVIRVLLRLLFYLSPVVYPVSRIPDRPVPLYLFSPSALDLYLLNPIAVYVAMFRAAMHGDPIAISTGHVAYGTLVAVFTFIAGALAFVRYEGTLVKYL